MPHRVKIRIIERTWAPEHLRFLVSCPDLACDGSAFATLQQATHALQFCLYGFPEDRRPVPDYLVHEKEHLPSARFPVRLDTVVYN